MDHPCVVCGDEPVVSESNGKRSTYCQTCGREETIELPKKPIAHHLAPVVSLTRAAVLKKINDKATQEQKKPKQLRDRTDYTKARRAR